jgi:hypothetical protein
MVLVWLLQAAIATWAFAAAAVSLLPLVSAPDGIGPAAISRPVLKSHLDLPALEVLNPMLDIKPRSDARAFPLMDPLSCEASGTYSSSAFTEGGSSRNSRRTARPDVEQQQLVQHRLRWMANMASGDRILLVLACLVQCISAVAVVATWKAFAERVQAAEGVPSASRCGRLLAGCTDIAPRFGTDGISMGTAFQETSASSCSGRLFLKMKIAARFDRRCFMPACCAFVAQVDVCLACLGAALVLDLPNLLTPLSPGVAVQPRR